MVGEQSKNHQRDSENLAKSGVIPFATDQHGFNPGRFFELYLQVTNQSSDRLFQKAQRKAKWFNIHNFSQKTLFENVPVGKNVIATMTKKLCQAAGAPDDYTNHCLRATGICTLKRLGYEDRAICNLSGM